MSDMYAIKTSTLTALGDAVRNKVGETRTEGRYEAVIETVELIFEGKASTNQQATNVIELTIPNAASVKIKLLEVGNGFDFMSCFTSGGSYLGAIRPSNLNEEIIYNLKNGYLRIYGLVVNTAYSYNKVELTFLDAEGNVLQEYKTEEVLNTMTPLQMAEEINNIPPGPTAKELTITGNCAYRFANSGWDWVIEKYGDIITTKDIDSAENMFNGCKILKIPFDLNFKSNMSYHKCSYLFLSSEFTEIPKLNGLKPYAADNIFNFCKNLRELDYESVKDIDWSYIDSQISIYGGSRASTFNYCYSLRSFPMEFLNHGNPVATYNYSIYNSLFYRCYALDEVIDLPVPHTKAKWTSNAFGSTIADCYRLKNFTFALQDDGTPYVCPNWTKQTIALTSQTGWAGHSSYKSNILNYNSGITADKEVKDDATYQALKNDPDWFSVDINYSRYNHDSAVATINSLPDCSAKGGNTITFKGAAGAKTDGGAINTLTEEEIAVAAAKGWTVSFVS